MPLLDGAGVVDRDEEPAAASLCKHASGRSEVVEPAQAAQHLPRHGTAGRKIVLPAARQVGNDGPEGAALMVLASRVRNDLVNLRFRGPAIGLYRSAVLAAYRYY